MVNFIVKVTEKRPSRCSLEPVVLYWTNWSYLVMYWVRAGQHSLDQLSAM